MEPEELKEPHHPVNWVSEEEIDYLLETAEKEEYIGFGKHLVVIYRLTKGAAVGWTIVGEGACIDPDRFSLEMGRQAAYKHAKSKLWGSEGYRKQIELSQRI